MQGRAQALPSSFPRLAVVAGAWHCWSRVRAYWNNDLPEGFDPMTAKELRQSLRRGSFVLPFLIVQALALAATIVEFQQKQAPETTEFNGVLNVWLLFSSGPFWMVAGLICMVLMPLGGVALMGQELEEGNHELLLLTKLNRWSVVLGKLFTLWGLSVVTFVSILPYVVTRYLIGGVEWWHEAACAGTVLGGSAMVGAGAIGASAFSNLGARIGVFVLFMVSMLAGCAPALLASAGVTKGCGILYHLTALAAIGCYTMMGLALARSRLRLSILCFEMKPSVMLLGLLVFAPFVIGTITAITLGFLGLVGLMLMMLVATTIDRTPKLHPAAGAQDATLGAG